jgi:hypothetical protein
MPEERDQALSFFRRINVLLSFLFMVISIPLLIYLVAPGWRTLMFTPPLCWGILAISLLLGFSNASHYYQRLQAKLRK